MELDLQLERLSAALPEHFPFYHLGEVTSRESNEEPTPDEDSVAISFRMHGDLQGILIVLFERGLDVSLYTELGNIIASQTATRLNQQQAMDVMISPPRLLAQGQVKNLLGSLENENTKTPRIRRTYLHTNGKVTVSVETLFLPIPSEGLVGYA